MDTIAVKTIVGPEGLTLEDGERLYGAIRPKIQAGEELILDFAGVGEVTTAFFNMSIARLYADFASEYLRELLHVVNLNTPGTRALNRSVENARSFYRKK
jgi:hypothetical protein